MLGQELEGERLFYCVFESVSPTFLIKLSHITTFHRQPPELAPRHPGLTFGQSACVHSERQGSFFSFFLLCVCVCVCIPDSAGSSTVGTRLAAYSGFDISHGILTYVENTFSEPQGVRPRSTSHNFTLFSSLPPLFLSSF